MKIVIGYNEKFEPIYQSLVSYIWEHAPHSTGYFQYWNGFYRLNYSEWKCSSFHINEHKTWNDVFVIESTGLLKFHVARSFLFKNKDYELAIESIIHDRYYSKHNFRSNS